MVLHESDRSCMDMHLLKLKLIIILCSCVFRDAPIERSNAIDIIPPCRLQNQGAKSKDEHLH